MLGARIATAAVLAAILIPGLIYGGVPAVALLVAAFGGTAIWELSTNLSGLKRFPGNALTLALGLVLVLAFYAFPLRFVWTAVVWLPLVVLLLHLFLYNVIENTIESETQMIFVLLYVAVPLGHALLLSRLYLGIAWVFVVLVVVSLADAGAYFAGRSFGRHRFSAHVSPAKTLEGLVGGLAGGLAGMIVMKLIVPGLPTVGLLFWLTLILVVADILGDLTASSIKRRLGIKDFGAILPGHGGVLDRADALIFAFPATYHFIIFVSGSAIPL